MGEREILGDNNQDNITDGSKSTSVCSDQNGNLNGNLTGNYIKACMASTASARQPDLDYLTHLLKDKKQLAAFSNIFTHVERLLDDEINRVRVALFQCKFAREPLQLPEPIGEVVLRQEKIFVPTKSHPDFNFVGRILGPRGMTAKQLESETGCKIMVRGKGSIRDKKKEDMNRGKANWEHLQEELHVLIQSEDTPNRNEVKIKRAVEEVNKLLVPSPEGEDELKKKQLMELAIINGTFRNGTPNGAAPAQSPSSAAALGQFAIAAGSFDQRLLSQQQNLNFSFAGLNGTVRGVVANGATLQSPALAGAPLIMQQATVSPQQQVALRGKPDAAQNGLLSISYGASPTTGGLASTQLAALAQAQATALQLQQFQQSAGATLIAANGANSALASGFASHFPATAATSAIAAQQQQQQQALNYQQILLNASQADPTTMAVQLAQLQQQQQQQQLQQQQHQLAALMQVSCANGTPIVPTFNSDQMAAMTLPYVGQQQLSSGINENCSTPTGGYGSSANNNSRSRRFIGQSRDHPYGKRDTT